MEKSSSKLHTIITFTASLIYLAEIIWKISAKIFPAEFYQWLGVLMGSFIANNIIGILGGILFIIVWWNQIRIWRTHKRQTENLKDKYPDTYPYIPDFPVWDALLYIQNHTNMGKDKYWGEIRIILEGAIKKGGLRIWVKESPGQDFRLLNLRQLDKAFLDIQPSDKIGKIRIISKNIYWDSPTISKKELEEFFKNK
jgi:hypothetical protein